MPYLAKEVLEEVVKVSRRKVEQIVDVKIRRSMRKSLIDCIEVLLRFCKIENIRKLFFHLLF